MIAPILTSPAGSFARFTVENRIPAILEDLMGNHEFPREVENRLRALLDSIPDGHLELLDNTMPYDGEINSILRENEEYGWLGAPFLFIENYLYHRIAGICGYKSNRRDYFLYRKAADPGIWEEKFSRGLTALNRILKDPPGDSFREIVRLNLMGNRADLSQDASYYSTGAESEILIDHTDRIYPLLAGSSRIDIVLDNAGEELFFDLLLVHWLFSRSAVKKIHLHFKSMPYFVSDALMSDYRMLVEFLSENGETASLASALNEHETGGRLRLSHDRTSDGLHSGLSRSGVDVQR